MGYTMPYSMKEYSLEDVQEKLMSEGPSAFLKRVRLQEDISKRADTPSTDQFVAQRLAKLAPASELVIIDPYLFPERPHPEVASYAARVAGLIAPLLAERATATAIVNSRSCGEVVDAASAELGRLRGDVALKVLISDDFHDRFWIADRSRGVIVGTSMNKIGSKIFFMDELRASDVAAIMHELDGIGR